MVNKSSIQKMLKNPSTLKSRERENNATKLKWSPNAEYSQ